MFKVYLSYSDHLKSVAVLDDDLLWQQLHDACGAVQVTCAATPKSKLLTARMWWGYEAWLTLYVRRLQVEAQRRGLGSWVDDERSSPYATAWLTLVGSGRPQAPKPPRWFGGLWFLEANRSELIRINPTHYAQRFPTARMELPYLWPQNRPGRFDYTVEISRSDLELLQVGERVIPRDHLEYLATKGLM
jgi:hypothetical protein